MEHIEKQIIDNRIHLIPENGYYVTDGQNIYSKYLILAESLTEHGFYAITDEEYNKVEEERANDIAIFSN